MANYCQFEISFDTDAHDKTTVDAFHELSLYAFHELSLLVLRKLCEGTTVDPATVHPMPRTSLDDPPAIYGECKWTARPAIEICEEFLKVTQIRSAEIVWSELGCEGLGVINVYLEDDGAVSHSEVYRTEPPSTISEIKQVIKECPKLEPQLQWYLDDLEAEAETEADA